MSITKNPKFKSTTLLSPEENKEILEMLGRKCVSLVTTIIQLYQTNPPDHSEWIYKDCGILCLIKDSKQRKYFFRLYCLVRKTVIWEYQLRKDMEYTCPRSFLSSFEGCECIFAFNFACTTEAGTFNANVLDRISYENKTGKREKKTKKKLSKKNISMPIEPQHNFHVGFKNMDVLKLSPAEIESYFEKKNINKKYLTPKIDIVPSVVAPILTFPKVSNQEIQSGFSILKSHPFTTFHDNQERITNNSRVLPKYVSAPSTPLLPRVNSTTGRKLLPKPSPKPLKTSLSTNHLYHSQSNASSYLSKTSIHDSFQGDDNQLSIDESLAILNDVSNLLHQVDTTIVSNISCSKERQVSEIDNALKGMLTRRNQFMQSTDDSSSFDTDD